MSGIKLNEEFLKKFGRTYPPDTSAAAEGDAGSTMFIIATGEVKVVKKTPSGERILASLMPGDFFGEMALLGLQEKRAASVKTTKETLVLELDRVAFEGMIKRSPEIAMSVITSLSERIRDSNGKLMALAYKDDPLRLSAYLAFLATEKGMPAPDRNPGFCFQFDVTKASATLGIEPGFILEFLGKAKKARIVGQSADWLWVPYPNYLTPFGAFLKAA